MQLDFSLYAILTYFQEKKIVKVPGQLHKNCLGEGVFK